MSENSGYWLTADRWVASRPAWQRILFSFFLLTGCAMADLASGNELSFSITYLAPTAFAAWFSGRLAGFTMASLAALVWLVIDLRSGHIYSHPMIPVWNMVVRLGFFLLVTYLLVHIRRLLSELRALAGTDSLTGLLNSRSFFERLDNERTRALRYEHPLTIAYIDLDEFKKVNDALGHEVGDRVLRAVAACLKASLRATDHVARLGGDEFAVLFAETGKEEAEKALGKLHRQLNSTAWANSWPIGFSIGAVTCEDLRDMDLQKVIHQADELMYQVKRSGKNSVTLRRAEQSARTAESCRDV